MADASAILNQISGGLDALAAVIYASHPSPQSMLETWGWNHPSMSVPEIADLVRSPKSLILKIDASEVEEADVQKLNLIPSRIQYLQANTVPQLPGGNGPVAFLAITSLIDQLNVILEKYVTPSFDLQAIEDGSLLPSAQIKKLKHLEGGIKRLGVEVGSFQEKVDEINNAHEAALSFPADIQMLEETRARYQSTTEKLEATFAAAEASRYKIEALREKLSDADEEANNVLANLGTAYSAATTKGLGAAFAERAQALTISTWVLGAVLTLSLTIGAIITYYRVEWVHQLMAKPGTPYGILFINMTYTALSVSAPVWLAWLLTRQIGQRFRLAEDYGYKASVAKAYEGYRKEAVRLDPAFESELFSIALQKLEEHPLRLVEHNSPGSPAHDVENSVRGLFSKPKIRTSNAKANLSQPTAPAANQEPEETATA